MWTSLAVSTADVGEAPDELVGSYTLNLTRNDLPGHPPPELSGGVGGWTLKSLALRPLGAQLRGGERQTRHSRRACLQRRRGSDFPDEQECATTDPGEMVESAYRQDSFGTIGDLCGCVERPTGRCPADASLGQAVDEDAS